MRISLQKSRAALGSDERDLECCCEWKHSGWDKKNGRIFVCRKDYKMWFEIDIQVTTDGCLLYCISPHKLITHCYTWTHLYTENYLNLTLKSNGLYKSWPTTSLWSSPKGYGGNQQNIKHNKTQDTWLFCIIFATTLSPYNLFLIWKSWQQI